ncbi:ribosomal L1 domain-containing protein CG13096-like [Cynara cardunculus var. scolymus]|uniref:ribosomal L1 domain-containing protein CG13096-like n=1 Tax=Cynara cardunculus var. scolymus TaxID=59895 RepID=UPI000D62C873|nr:ribosomal L1 domain-containing protein CG13096-like [Cynara cardunculus var. scolymus]
MKQILATLQQPIQAAEPSFTADDREQLHLACEANVIMARALTKLEELMKFQIHTVDHFFGYCSKTIVKEGETVTKAGPCDVDAVPATEVEAEAPIAEDEVDVADESPTSYEALITKDVEVARAKARDDDPPITSAADAGDLDEDSDDEEYDESLDLPDTGKDLDDDEDEDEDEDDDDDDFTIQYQRPTDATKGVALRDSSSQGEQGVKEAAQEKHQGTKSMYKGVAKDGNLKILFQISQPLFEDSS